MKADAPPIESARTSPERAQTCIMKNSIRVALRVGVSDRIIFGVLRMADFRVEE